MSKPNLPAISELEPNENTVAHNQLLEFLRAKREKAQGFHNQFKSHKTNPHTHTKLKEGVKRMP